MMRSVFVVLLLLVLAGCDFGVEWTEEDYEVHWIDSSNNRTLARKIKTDPGSTIGRVSAEVTAVGSNDNYIVAKQKEPTTKLISYFIIDKSKDGQYLNLEEITEGPFSERQFLQLKKELDLPEFSNVFE